MEKIIEVTEVSWAVSLMIHVRRISGLGFDNPLRDKELKRFKSMIEPVVIPENAGDPGRLKVNHGCEARGI
ncbi:hypothetical protein [Vibrio parahaemolyticus]|uniref:hypothetical protein n=1 Tax=Vibrio parahaemolyticus TaxID=670 RepID=UPI002362D5EE|nr:hypothetical protein [Vibrio parahaemolyticus]